jgi:hypothetical protein
MLHLPSIITKGDDVLSLLTNGKQKLEQVGIFLKLFCQ